MPWWQVLLIGLGATVVVYATFVVALILAGRRSAARAVATFVPDCLILFRRLLGDPRVPLRHKLLLAALIPYLALPFDLIPDFIPVAGYLDDAVIVALALGYVLRGSQASLVEQHWPGPRSSLDLLLRLTTRTRRPGAAKSGVPKPGRTTSHRR
jgi:uncharacterized membrane protein YkvA (DUF1232 family)